METASYFKDVRLVGGDLALDFANTQTGPPDGPPDGDALDGYDDLLNWSRQMGTIGERQAEGLVLAARARPAAASAAFRKAVGARSYLGEIFATLARQQEPSASLLDLLRDDAASAIRYSRLARTAGGFAWYWAMCEDLRVPLWPLVQAAADLLLSGHVTSVKQCGACRFLFVDTSKNGSRRWCSMEDCGKTAKMRRYVARRSVSRASARFPASCSRCEPTRAGCARLGLTDWGGWDEPTLGSNPGGGGAGCRRFNHDEHNFCGFGRTQLTWSWLLANGPRHYNRMDNPNTLVLDVSFACPLPGPYRGSEFATMRGPFSLLGPLSGNEGDRSYMTMALAAELTG